VTGATSAAYTWDDADNLTGATAGGIIAAFVADDDDRLVSATTAYTWDAMGHLIQVASAESTSTYAYGATGMREFASVETSEGVTWTKSVWAGGRLVAELDSDGTRLDYLHAPDGTPVAVKVTGGTAPGLYCYHTDASGSVVAITKAVTGAQTLVATYAYGPFGEQTGSTGTNPIASRNPLRYRGYYADGATGLYYLPARYYDPDVARFLSKDPAPPQAGDPGSLNAYAYCHGDPVNLEDPSGAIADTDGNGRVDGWDSAWSASRHASHWRRRDEFRQWAISRYYAELAKISPEDRLDPGSVAFLEEQARKAESATYNPWTWRPSRLSQPDQVTLATGVGLDLQGPIGQWAAIPMDLAYGTTKWIQAANHQATAGDVALSYVGAIPGVSTIEAIIVYPLCEEFDLWAEPE
jgi:RHS repeat-associated protein